MKAAKRSILICVLTLILSVSLLAGVTFAWFTDSITNSGNTIQSGELAIDATAYDRVDAAETDGLTVTIGEGNVASGTYYFEAEGASLRNGDPVITEENWQPGDMNAKLFTVSNEGSIDAVVSLDFFVSGDLAQYLWYDFIAVNPADGSLLGEFLQRNDLTTLQALAADREFPLSPAAGLEDGGVSQVTFLFVYGLPTSATNEAMNKAVNVNVVVSAKQNVEGAEGPVVVNPGTDLSETTIDSGDTILLSEGDYEVSQPVTVEGKQNIVIDGNGATIKASSAEGASIMSATSKSIAVAADTQTDLANNIINVSGATNVTIRNLTIEGALHHGINIWECENVVLENVTIINSDATAITINGSNVTLNSVTTSGSGWGGVNVDLGNSGSSEITVDESCAFGEFLPIYADSEAIAAHITVNVPENYNKAIVDLTGIGEDGVERVVWSSTIVETADELNSALFDGGNIIIANDMTVNSFAGYYRQISTDVTVYLNNKTVTSTQTQNTTINGYSTLNLVYGSLVFNNMEAVNAASLLPITGSTVTLDNVKLTSNGTALYPRGDAARVEVVNSEITAPVYAVGTNAGEVDNYNVEIYIYGSTLKTYYTDLTSGSITVFVNVPCSLTIENSYIYGVQNAVMVRCGTATIKNSTLSTPNGVSLDDINLEATWSSGNEVPFGTLLVGNGTTTSYQNAATVTVENTTITSNNAEVPAIYIWGNATEEIGATLTVDEFTWTNKTGALAGDPAGTYGDVTVNLPEGYTLVDSYEELATAVTVGGYVVLANDITIVPAGIGDALIPQMNINENTTLYLNGKTLSFDKTATTESLSYTPAFFGVMSGATLTIYGDGVIDAEANYNNSFGINVNGGNLVINGGTYYGAMSAVQVQKGNCTINGGHFELADTIKEAAPQYSTYLINCIDASISDGTAVININGGTFVNYNPSASQGEPNAPVSFVDGENYEVESVVQSNGETWYTVVPKA
ncbi:MAG TPA: hypothetical protein IAC90_05790 [Candidatus Coproplasma stercorigallinarum]|nr:hypothetical protein [Candidatus Coproplasma stercorigallinarum]